MNKYLILGSGASACKDLESLRIVCNSAMAHGILQFDTAPSYKTEEMLSKAISLCGQELGISRETCFIQTKIDPIQMYNGNVEEYFKRKLSQMNLDYVDSLLVHWPLQKYFMHTWESLQKLKDKKCVIKIGICNLRVRHLKKLLDLGVVPDILQIERHPLNIFEEERVFCQQHNIQLQDYSPLCKMHPRIREDAGILNIAKKYNRSVGQIVLRWHIDTGAFPVFTSTRPERVKQYSQLDDFSLTQKEIEIISSLNCNHKLYLESLICPGF